MTSNKREEIVQQTAKLVELSRAMVDKSGTVIGSAISQKTRIERDLSLIDPDQDPDGNT